MSFIKLYDSLGKSFIHETPFKIKLIYKKSENEAINLKEYLEEDFKDEETKQDQEELQKNLQLITEYILEKNLILVDSDMPNFTDELDESLKQNNNTK